MSIKSALHQVLEKIGLRRRSTSSADTKNIDPRKTLGKAGEDFALALLQQRGHKLVARNVLFKRGELDLVTWQGQTLVFTEVRTRSGMAFGTPAESVNARKQASVRRAAHTFLSRTFKDGRLPDCRFDIVWLLAQDGRIMESGVIEGAF